MPSSPITRENERKKYMEAYTTTRYGAKPGRAKPVRAPELDQIEPDSTYLDVSCGRGEALKQVLALNRNVKVRGTEMVPALCNDFVQNAELPELEGVEGADFVSCYEVLEHLPTHNVLPAFDRLFELSRKMLIISTNDMPSRSKVIEHDDPLHLSRFPQRWWIQQLELRCMKRNARPFFRHLRERHVERPDGPRRFWVFGADFRKPFEPLSNIDYYGYDSDMTDLWFWKCEKFPVSQISRPVRSTQAVLDHPAVKALWRSLDKHGMENPVLLHNIPGAPERWRNYAIRCGNHRVEWAMTRGLKTIPALVYGGCEYEPCVPMTMREAQRWIRYGRISFAAPQPPDIIDVPKWHTDEGPWLWDDR